jgi:hypothetical protein
VDMHLSEAAHNVPPDIAQPSGYQNTAHGQTSNEEPVS